MRASKRLRRQMTPPEALLWQLLRRSPAGIKFRRQYAIGHYIADFYCPAAKLVIEVDGQIHGFDKQAQHDAIRDEAITRFGVRIERVPAAEILRDARPVASAIIDTCLAISPSPRRARRGLTCGY